MPKVQVKTESAEAFKLGEDWPEKMIYRFPFQCMDAPGPRSLGCIEWWLEPVRGRKARGRYSITSLLLWARQTRDTRYANKLFEVLCNVEALSGGILKRDGLLSHIWSLGFCPDHGRVAFGAYPLSRHTGLIIDVSLTIQARIQFE